MSENLKTWPVEIYIQAGDPDYIEPEEGEPEGDRTFPYKEVAGPDVTWCSDEIYEGDVPYLRKDTVAAGPWRKHPDFLPGCPKWILRYRPNAPRPVTLSHYTAWSSLDWNDVTHWAEIQIPDGRE